MCNEYMFGMKKKRNYTTAIKRAFENYRWFDYEFLLDIEYAVWKDWLNRYTIVSKDYEINSSMLRSASIARIAISLLDIIANKKEIIEQTDPNAEIEWRELLNGKHEIISVPEYQVKKGIYVNTKNANRIMPQVKDYTFTNPSFIKDLYQEKAWLLYNKLRTYYLRDIWF